MLHVVSSKARGEASMSAKNGSIKLVAGNSNPALAQDIAKGLGIELTKAVVRRFADMEIFVEIQENVRGSDMFILQSTSYPANDNLMELLIITDALRRSSARRITAVIPYFGYARQDRRSGDRRPGARARALSAKLRQDDGYHPANDGAPPALQHGRARLSGLRDGRATAGALIGRLGARRNVHQ